MSENKIRIKILKHIQETGNNRYTYGVYTVYAPNISTAIDRLTKMVKDEG